MIKRLLLAFANKIIEYVYKDNRKGIVGLLILNSPDSDDVLDTLIKLTDAFIEDSIKVWNKYLKSEKFQSSLIAYLIERPDIENLAEFLDEEDGFMALFNKNLSLFYYNINPFLCCLNPEDYLAFKDYMDIQLDEFDELVLDTYASMLRTMNVEGIIDTVTSSLDN